MRRVWFKHLREARGFTQKGLAHAVGATLRAVQNWEGGQRTPSRAKQFELAIVLGKSVLKHFDAECTERLEASA